MTKENIKKLIIGGAIVLVLAGAAIGLGIVASNARKKRKAAELEDLFEIAKKEGNLSEDGYEKLRKLLYLDNYELPASMQASFDKIKPLLQRAGNSIRQGYAVSAMQYFPQINSIISTLSVNDQGVFYKVENLIREAFKLNSSSTTAQEAINDSNKKSAGFWRTAIEVVAPIPTILITGDSVLYNAYKEYKAQHLYPDVLEFNKKLLDQDTLTLKLFSEAFNALSGKDYFEIQKNPS